MHPRPRTLRVVSPHLHGPDVAVAQRMLGIDADGVYGPATAEAVAAWKHSRGLGDSGELGPDERHRLLRDVPLRAVRIMVSWVGLEEEPPRSNRVPELVALAERLHVAPALAGMGYPWCAFAVFLAALETEGRTATAGLRRRAFNAVYTPAILREARAGRFGLEIVANPFRGDIAVFDWDFAAGDPADHAARLLRTPESGLVQTVDGNSGGDGLVRFRERPMSSVRAFLRDS